MPKKIAEEDRMLPVFFRLHPDDKEFLRVEAGKVDRDPSFLLRKIVQAWIEKRQKVLDRKK